MLYHIPYLLTASLLGLSMRLPFTLLSNTATDAWGEYGKLKGWSRKSWNDHRILDSANPGIFPRPYLFHYLISGLPQRYWRIAAVLGTHLSDVLVGILVYVLFQVAASDTLKMSESEIRFGGFLAMLLFLTTPLLLPSTARLRANNGRAPGLLLCTLYFTLLIWGIANGSWVAFVLAILFVYLVILTSTFGTQVIVFFSIPLSLYFFHFAPVLIPLVVLIVGWVVPSLGVRSLLIFKKHHTEILLQNISTHVAGKRNLLTNVGRFFYALFHRELYQAHQILFKHSPLLILLYTVPSLWLAAYLGLVYGRPEARLLISEWWSFGVAMTLASFLTFVLTSTGPGRIFGEAERYFEYSLPMICLSLTLWTYESPLIATTPLTVMIILQLGLIPLLKLIQWSDSVAMLTSYDSMLKQSIDPDLIDVVDILAEQNGEVRVATMPMRKLALLLSSLTLYATYGRVKYYYHMMLSSKSLKDGMNDYFTDTDSYFTFRVSPQMLNNKYGIQYILVDKTEYDMQDGSKDDHPFWGPLQRLPVLYENTRFIIYKVTGPAPETVHSEQGSRHDTAR